MPQAIRWRIQLIYDEIGRRQTAAYLKVGPVMLDELMHPQGRVPPSVLKKVVGALDDAVASK